MHIYGMILDIFPHVVPLILMLPLFQNTAYTYVAWGWCLLIYFDTRYIQYNLINFVSLNVIPNNDVYGRYLYQKVSS